MQKLSLTTSLITTTMFSIPSIAGTNFGIVDVGAQYSMYNYREPSVMKLKGNQWGPWADIYLQPAADSGLALMLSGEYNRGRLDYDSAGTGSADNMHNYYYDISAKIGYNLLDGKMTGSEERANYSILTPYVGIARRYLNNNGSNAVSTTGHTGYERESRYNYMPIGLYGYFKDDDDSMGFQFQAEYRHFLDGKQNTHLPLVGGGTYNVTNKQKEGSGYHLFAGLSFAAGKATSILVGPYYRRWNIKDSEVARIGNIGLFEPKNHTTEFGIRLGLKFAGM